MSPGPGRVPCEDGTDSRAVAPREVLVPTLLHLPKLVRSFQSLVFPLTFHFYPKILPKLISSLRTELSSSFWKIIIHQKRQGVGSPLHPRACAVDPRTVPERRSDVPER